MDLTQLANLGEFIGGVAVLVTLVYLAAQVRQTSKTPPPLQRSTILPDLLRRPFV